MCQMVLIDRRIEDRGVLPMAPALQWVVLVACGFDFFFKGFSFLNASLQGSVGNNSQTVACESLHLQSPRPPPHFPYQEAECYEDLADGHCWLNAHSRKPLMSTNSWQCSQKISIHSKLEKFQPFNCRYERVTIHHSWNANWLFTNSVIFSLQRHSDHHENAYKPYQVHSLSSLQATCLSCFMPDLAHCMFSFNGVDQPAHTLYGWLLKGSALHTFSWSPRQSPG